MESIVILLTGTIKVSNVPNLLMTSTTQREFEYLKSIKKWAVLGYPVIFCENSNYDSEKINNAVKDLGPHEFEYLKLVTKVSQMGKGRGEAEIIDFVFKNSRLLRNHTIICKATGKNFVTNANEIINKILQPSFMQNIVVANLKSNLTFADSRFFFFKKDFYHKYWVQYIEEVNEHKSIFLEHTLARSIHAALAASEQWAMLPSLPVYEGYYGTNATIYRNGFLKRFAKKIWYSVKRKAIASRT